jgi:hypothetical protein
MASYRKYAENLIGNWNTDQYEPQRDATLSSYRTNWDKLQNDFTIYMDKLNRNLKTARTNYHDSLADAAENSYLRNNTALESLSNRGLIGSGIAQKYAGADTTARGQEITDALSKIINTNTSYLDALEGTIEGMANKENKLNQNLAKALGNITGAEQENLQGYANTLANIASNAESRELSNALANASLSASSASKKAQEEEDEFERRKLIFDTLANTEMSDDDKVKYMAIYLDVPSDVGEQALEAYKNNNKKAEKAGRAYALGVANEKLKNSDWWRPENLRWSDLFGTSGTSMGILDNLLGAGLNKLINDKATVYSNVPNIPTIVYNERQRKINNLNKESDSLSYTDLYDLLFNNE